MGFDMTKVDSSDQASQYIHNVRRVIEITNSNTLDASISAVVLSLAETYLSFDPTATSKAECYDPIFFLHILWCEPNSQGIDQTARKLRAFLEEEVTVHQIEILTSLQNVLCAARQVPAIREDLRDPCNINNLIGAALIYAFLTSAGDWDEEEWDCLDIFLREAWTASDEETRKVAANHLQGYIENFSVEPSESIFKALFDGRIITPNTDIWGEA